MWISIQLALLAAIALCIVVGQSQSLKELRAIKHILLKTSNPSEESSSSSSKNDKEADSK